MQGYTGIGPKNRRFKISVKYKMSHFKFLNLDSKDSAYSTIQSTNTFTFNSTNSTTECPNSYNTEWTLRVPIQNPKRIWLKSVELPIGFANVRKNNGSNTLVISTLPDFNLMSPFIWGESYFTASIPDKIYTSIESLLDDLNIAFNTAYSPVASFTFSLNADGFVMVQSSTFFTPLYLKPGILANTILGFDPSNAYNDPAYSSIASARCAKSMFLLNPDNYINLFISNLSSTDCNNNGVPSSFKIPLFQTNGTVQYSGSNAGFDQSLPVNSVNVINKISIQITDRWGFSICSRGLDYSLTLAVEM